MMGISGLGAKAIKVCVESYKRFPGCLLCSKARWINCLPLKIANELNENWICLKTSELYLGLNHNFVCHEGFPKRWNLAKIVICTLQKYAYRCNFQTRQPRLPARTNFGGYAKFDFRGPEAAVSMTSEVKIDAIFRLASTDYPRCWLLKYNLNFWGHPRGLNDEARFERYLLRSFFEPKIGPKSRVRHEKIKKTK